MLNSENVLTSTNIGALHLTQRSNSFADIGLDTSLRLGQSSQSQQNQASVQPKLMAANSNPNPFFNQLGILADFNGDRKSDIFWRNSQTGENAVWLMDGTNIATTAVLHTVPTEWDYSIADFNGDGKSDIFWRNRQTGENAVWLMNGTNIATPAVLHTVPLSWDFKIADFNGDGKSDIFWRNRQTGENAVWLMDGTNIATPAVLTTVPTQWNFDIADFNGDGKSDIFWRNAQTGENATWLMNGTNIATPAVLHPVPLSWDFKIADFNGDGKSDIFWRNRQTGENAVWLMNGTNIATPAVLHTVPLSWDFKIADFNGDRKSDIFWRNRQTGENAIWLMNGTNIATPAVLQAVPLSWDLSIGGDFNGDGKSDIFWHNHDTGENAVWLMDGTNIANAAVVQTPPPGSQQQWIRQLGTTGDDFSYSVATDSAGNVYITGYTDGSLGGTNAGGRDTWLAKYSSSGTLVWTKQLGTASDDFSYSLAVDSAGNAYITGHSQGLWFGFDNGWGDGVALIAKYDSSGTLVWTELVDYIAENEYSYSIAVDSAGNVYMTGLTDDILEELEASDSWVIKYSSSGEKLWIQRLNTSGDDYAVTADSTGNVYIAGFTDGSLAGSNNVGLDAWVAKYDSFGNQLFIKQLDTSNFDISSDVAIDSAGNVYITGTTYNASQGTNAGSQDALVAKYNSSGKMVWSRQVDVSGDDFASNVVVDSNGNVYITGSAEGTLQTTNTGTQNTWVAKCDSNGTLIWTKPLGTSSKDFVNDVTVDSAGNVYITGETEGAVGGASAGGVNAWVAKYRWSA